MLKQLIGDLFAQAWRRLRGGARAIGPARASPGALPGEAATLRAAFDRLLAADDCDGALALVQAAAAAAPGDYEACLLAGRARQKLHDLDGARAAFEEALRRRGDDAELHDFLGQLHQELGRLPQAIAAYERALALRPGHAPAAFHLAMARLLAGDYARGWDGYELRLQAAAPATGVAAALPRWDGAPLAGRRLFVSREQGLGDEIMFGSILPQLARDAARDGGRCVVECDPRLQPLLARSIPEVAFVGSLPGGGVPAQALPAPVDCAIEAGSLPRHYRRARDDFPRHEGYLRADPRSVAAWRERLAALGPGLKLGLAWTGGVRKTRRALRSLPLEALLPLLRVPGVRFVSLQYTADAPGEVEALRARHGVAVEHWPEAIDDVEQTAALVCALDLVVSVCTTLVHLAGALGRPAWVMVPLGPEWRYGAAGATMPWYPSVRLFRQLGYKDWAPVVDAVRAELAARAAGDDAVQDAGVVDALRVEGAKQARAGRHGEALVALRAALVLRPEDGATANLAGLCCSLAGRHEEALAHYDRALELDAGCTDALANAGWSATLLGGGAANGYFRRWLAHLPAQVHGPETAPLGGRLALPEVSLCCVDCAYHDLAARALRTTLAGCEFGRALFLSDRDCRVSGVEFVPIDRLASTQAYSNFMIHDLHRHVGAGHVLVIQYDGFVLNPAAWDPVFLQYDYIGPAVRLPDGRAGGIGGFSLRSRRLLDALRDDPAAQAYDAARVPYAEDIAICCALRRRLEERHGIRFAPAEVADRFAAEAIAPTPRSFGFHNLMHLVSLHQNGFRLPEDPGAGIPILFRAGSALGPVLARRELELRARGDNWARFLDAA
jgi:tetratricopeptide (TPR) repeat protein